MEPPGLTASCRWPGAPPSAQPGAWVSASHKEQEPQDPQLSKETVRGRKAVGSGRSLGWVLTCIGPCHLVLGDKGVTPLSGLFHSLGKGRGAGMCCCVGPWELNTEPVAP
ncbi:hypothetical protein H1C71_039841 [Ictidomys tridecemlineatus]|nr:hypothetical protein H1C71_039841 [Ictidomys tridecemlineatus]